MIATQRANGIWATVSTVVEPMTSEVVLTVRGIFHGSPSFCVLEYRPIVLRRYVPSPNMAATLNIIAV
jgi:hypothetical protein